MAKKGKREFLVRPYSERLISQYEIRCDKNGTLWLYNADSGLWSPNGDRLIEQTLRECHLDAENICIHYVREIVSDVKSLCLKDKEFPAPLWHLIPFQNKVYDLRSRQFSNFVHGHNFTSKLAVKHNPESQGCPFIDKIFHEFVKPEDVTDLYELAAYCMLPSYPNQEFFFILGPGRNGKSVYVNIIISMLGKMNTSAVSLHELQTDKFAGSDLHGKFANICTELRYNDLNNTDLIKKLTGNDRIRAQGKFTPAFTFLNYAKLIFVSNELPRTKDKTPAFYRRARIINFPHTFEADKEDKTLMEKITPQELEGLAFKCVGILHDMMHRNFTFTKLKSTDERAVEYETLSNPIDTFIQGFCEHDGEGFIAKTDFKGKLDGWLRSTGQRVRMDKEIIQYMRDKGINDRKRSFGENERKNSWVGIAWKQ